MHDGDPGGGEAVPERYELRCVTGTGQVRWMSTRASALLWEGRPATMTFFTDVTEQRSTLEALRSSEKRYRTVVQQLGEGKAAQRVEQAVMQVTTKLKSLAAGKMGYSTTEVGDLVVKGVR